MSTRSIVILLVIALGLAAAVLVFERQVSQETKAGPDEYKVFKAYTKDQVHRVNLVKGDMTVQLVRQADGWVMNSPVAADADNKRVAELLEQLGELMEVAAPIKAGPGEKIDLKEYGLHDPVGKIIISYGGVAEAELSLGRRTENPNQQYGRLGKENRIMIINAAISELLEAVAADQNLYRSRRIFQDKHIDKALKIRLDSGQRDGEGLIALEKDEQSNRWLLSEPLKDRADQEAVAELLKKCGAVRVIEFVELPADKDVLAKLLNSCGLLGQAGTPAVAIAAEGMQNVVLYLGKKDEQGKYRWGLIDKTAVLAGSQELVKIPAKFAGVLPRSVQALRDKKFLRFDNTAISQVRISSPEGDIVLEPKKGEGAVGWLLKGPRERTADKKVVERFLDELRSLRATDFVDKSESDTRFAESYLIVEVKSDEKGQSGVLEIGALTADGTARYARLRRDRAIRKVRTDKAEGLAQDWLNFCERELAKINRWQVDSFEIRHMGGSDNEETKCRAIYKAGQWWLREPSVARAKNDAVREVLGILDPLRAERIVAVDVADTDMAALSQYGLDKPEYELTVVEKGETEQSQVENKSSDEQGDTSKPRKVHVLLIGKAGEQCYGRLRGRGEVFAIKNESVDKLDVDLRSKKVLPLSQWQIGSLSKVQIVHGKETLLLEKLGDGWKVAGEKEFWPDQKVVGELLRSLLELEASEFGSQETVKQCSPDEAIMTVSITLDEDQADKQKIYRFFVAALGPDKGYAIKTEDEDIVRVLPAEKLAKLERNHLAYRKKQMLDLKTNEVQAIEIIENKKKRYLAQLKDTQWQLVVPDGGALELTKLEDVLEIMCNLQATEMVAEGEEAAREYGLDKPKLTVKLELTDEWGQDHHYALLIGDEVKDKEGARYAKLLDDEIIFVVKAEDARVLREGLVFQAEGYEE